jgi:hypothetical protein
MQEYIDIKQYFGKDLEEIFNNPEFEEIPQIKYGFHAIDEIEKNSLLFIGLNPSRVNSLPSNCFYHLKQRGNDYQKFWKPFENLSEATNLGWAHLDILSVRETNQSAINEIFNLPNGIDFIYKQVMISKQIIELSNPKIIVVANTLARTFMGLIHESNKKEWMGYDYKFDEELGTERIITDGPLKNTPVFFTSMLSGQRAMDWGTKQRLIWHIKHVNKLI